MTDKRPSSAILTTPGGAILITIRGSSVAVAPSDPPQLEDAVRIAFSVEGRTVEYCFRTMSQFFHALENGKVR